VSVFRRGEVWWFKFRFQGQVIRESASTKSKTLAREAERARRRELETAVNRIPKRERPPLFRIAAEQWLESRRATLSKGAYEAYRAAVKHLVERFGTRLVCDLDHGDVAALQNRLSAAGKSARTVNLAVAVLRMVLKGYGLWAPISDRVKGLRERHDVGRAISHEDEERILAAISQSRSPALLPLFVLSIDTGLRAAEVRALKRRDLGLEWNNGLIERGELRVPKSKTDAGQGRVVPLTSRARAVLSLWLSRFPEADTDAYVFPAHKIGLCGDGRETLIYAVDPTRPMGFWKKAWRGALKRAAVDYRWHDTRHSFISRLCENPAVSEQTIMALAGHVSRPMLNRYSHIRMQAKQAAIAALERATTMARTLNFESEGAQNGAQPCNRAELN
jgi:integrase